MYINHYWLQEWLKSTTLDPDKVKENFSLRGFETELANTIALSGMVVGEITSATKVEGSKKLNLCSVDIGKGQELQIICGCSSVAKGLKVAVATVGTKLPGLVIAKRKVMGIESSGMLCTKAELGHKHAKSAEGIWHLSSSAKIGQSLAEYLKTSTTLYEIDVTPNRGDVMSLRGMTRELAQAYTAEATAPWVETAMDFSTLEALPQPVIEVSAEHACSAMHCLKVDGIQAVATPDWLELRLSEAGISSHNIIVDVLNYVMLETNQPLHAYDANTCSDEFAVGFAQAEDFQLLDGQTAKLDQATLVIKNANKPVCIAGYMGGANTQVQADTSSIYLEAASFTAATIAHSCRRYQKYTQSGSRFERGVDPEIALYGMCRALQLLQQLTGATPRAYAGVSNGIKLRKIQLDESHIQRVLGFSYSIEEVEKSLSKMSFGLRKNTSGWEVEVPSWRLDIRIQAQLVAELLRDMGMPELKKESMLISLPAQQVSSNGEPQVIDSLRSMLIACGMQETQSYSFISAAQNSALQPEKQKSLGLKNPLSQTMAVMRSHLYSGLLQQLQHNINQKQDSVRLLEMGRVFYHDESGSLQQPRMLALALFGRIQPENWSCTSKRYDFFAVQALAKKIFNHLGLSEQQWKEEAKHGMHPHQSGEWYLGGEPCMSVGRIHPETARELVVSEEVYFLQANVDHIINHVQQQRAQSVCLYPKVRRDLCLFVPKKVQYTQIESIIHENTNNYLKEVLLFDIYSGNQVPDGCASMSIGLVFQHAERTLVENDVQPMIMQCIAALKQINVNIRGE